MGIPLEITQYQQGGTQYYRYSTPQIGHRFAEGSFAAEGISPEQARQIAAQKSAKYLNVPIYDISGFEAQAPSPEVIGVATSARQEQYATSRANIAALHQQREQLRQGFTGEFKTEYAQRMAQAPIGSYVPTQKEYAQVKYLTSPTAQWASPETFQAKAAQVERYAPFAGVTEFRGQIIQQAPSLRSFAPTAGYQYESPFGKGLIKKENFPGALPQTPIGRERLTLMPIVSKASAISRGSQAFIESGIDVLPLPGIAKEFTKGASSMITGIPEFFATGAAGWETAIRKPQAFKSYVLPSIADFGKQFAEQATTRPVYTVGQIAVMGAGARGIKLKTIAEVPKLPKQLSVFEPAKGVKAVPSGRATTWNLKPTPEYIQAKFGEYNVFKGGNIEGLAKSLKTAPTAPRLPPQIRPMGVMRPIAMPKQISAATPIKGLTITEIKPTPAPKGTEIRVGQGLVQIQRQKTVTVQKQRLEVIQAPKLELKSSVALKSVQIARQRAILTYLPVFQPLTKSMSMTAQRQKVSPITAFAQRTVLKTTPIMKPITSQKAMQAMKPMTATAQKALVRQMPRMETKARTISIFPEIPKIPKLRPSSPLGRRKGKRGTLGFGKFGEIARVAAPSQIFKGFSFGAAKPRRRKKR